MRHTTNSHLHHDETDARSAGPVVAPLTITSAHKVRVFSYCGTERDRVPLVGFQTSIDDFSRAAKKFNRYGDGYFLVSFARLGNQCAASGVWLLVVGFPTTVSIPIS